MFLALHARVVLLKACQRRISRQVKGPLKRTLLRDPGSFGLRILPQSKRTGVLHVGLSLALRSCAQLAIRDDQ